MKIALINENSQAAKNGIIEAALKKDPQTKALCGLRKESEAVVKAECKEALECLSLRL